MRIKKTCENCEMNMCGNCGEGNQDAMEKDNTCESWQPNIFYLDFMTEQLPENLKSEFLNPKSEKTIEWLIAQFK